MKIVYFTSCSFLDCDLPLISELRKKGHDVYLFFEVVPRALHSTLFDIKRQVPQTDLFPILIYDEMKQFGDYIDFEKSYVLNRTGKVYGWKNLLLRYKFYKKIKEINPDIIYSTNYIDLFDRFVYLFKNKIVQMVHDPFPHKGENYKRKQLNRNYAFKKLKSFVLLNKSQRTLFSTTYNIPSENIYQNKLGPYDCIHLFKSTLQEDDQNKNLVLFWGRISPYKGIDVLLKAMDVVHCHVPSANLIVAGAGKYYFDKSDYENKTYIQFFNQYLTMNQLHDLLQKAKVVVCPYIEATQSGVVMTSFAMNVPVIATNVGGLPEMVEDDVTGIIVQPQNVEDLANAIIRMFENSDAYLKYVNNIDSLKKNGMWSWSVIADKYIEIFRKTIET